MNRTAPILRIVLLLIIVALLHHRWASPRISVDQMRQLVAIENIVQGHGITFQLPGESTEIQRNNSFPPGYYALLLPFYELFNDPILLHRLFELIGLTALIIQLLLLGGYVEKKYGLRNARMFFVIFALIQLNPFRASGFTDIWSLFFFIAAFRMSISLTAPSVNRLLAIGILSFATVCLRYAYYPLAFIPPILVLLNLPRTNWRSYVSLASLALLLGAMKVFDLVYFNGHNHLKEKLNNDTWHFEHILQMDPVGFNAFFSDHVLFGFLNLNRLGVDTHWGAKYLFLGLSIVILFILAVLTIKHLAGKTSNKVQNNALEIGIWLTVLVNLGFITALSVYFPSKSERYMYTWSLISRYFAPAYVVLHLLAIMLWYRANKGWEKFFIRTLVVASICFQTAYFASYTWRFSLTDSWSNYVRFYDRPEMPEVMKNYEILRADHDRMIEIPKEHMNYQYLTFYYLSGNPHVIKYVEQNCPECLQ